mmetsp:Transcript_21354/g.36439  ORF Transcript_21354/g.36439 Transcript_21354/m.36439 type:complete len:206 (-) Transcript_21354:268-885(-)
MMRQAVDQCRAPQFLRQHYGVQSGGNVLAQFADRQRVAHLPIAREQQIAIRTESLRRHRRTQRIGQAILRSIEWFVDTQPCAKAVASTRRQTLLDAGLTTATPFRRAWCRPTVLLEQLLIAELDSRLPAQRVVHRCHEIVATHLTALVNEIMTPSNGTSNFLLHTNHIIVVDDNGRRRCGATQLAQIKISINISCSRQQIPTEIR